MASAPGRGHGGKHADQEDRDAPALQDGLAPDDAGHVDADQDHRNQEGDAKDQEHARDESRGSHWAPMKLENAGGRELGQRPHHRAATPARPPSTPARNSGTAAAT